MIKKILAVGLILFLFQGCDPANSKSNKAIDEIIQAFDIYPLVAIGESHGWKEGSEFIFELLKNPSFSKKVNDIVVECGNAGYQSLMDDYINGKDVPITELQQAWRNMTVLCTCDAPIYEQLFQTVRAVNQESDTKYKIRVLLGEPPINWKKINKSDELGSWVFQRDEHYASVVEKEVLQKNRKALLIMGSLHFIKKGWGVDPQIASDELPFNNSNPNSNDTSTHTFMMPVGDSSEKEKGELVTKEISGINNKTENGQAPNVSQILEQKYPGKLFIILPYDGYGDLTANEEIERKFNSSEEPAFLNTAHSWIGKLDAGKLFTRKSLSLTNGKITGEVIFNPYPNLKLSDMCDAFLYISDRKSMTRSVPTEIFKDAEYMKELNRRSMIISGNLFRLSDYTDTSLKLHSN